MLLNCYILVLPFPVALIVLIVYGQKNRMSTTGARKKSNVFKRLGKKFIFIFQYFQTLTKNFSLAMCAVVCYNSINAKQNGSSTMQKLTKQQQQHIAQAHRTLNTLAQQLTTLQYMQYKNGKRVYDVTHWEQAIENIEEELCECINENGI